MGNKDNNEIKKINNMIGKLNNAIEKLEKENYNVWVKDVHYEGYGFKVILDKVWVDVWVMLNYGEECEVFIRKFEKTSNILDSYANKELAKAQTKNLDEIYDTIKEFVKNEVAL